MKLSFFSALTKFHGPAPCTMVIVVESRVLTQISVVFRTACIKWFLFCASL